MEHLNAVQLVEGFDPGLENALIQAGYGEGISGETAGSIQLRRTQTFSVNDPVASSFRLHVGNAGTRYQITLIAFVDAIPTRSSGNYLFVKFAAPRQRLLRLGNVIFVSEQGQKFSFDPILPYFQELASYRIFKVHCMWYVWRFYEGFSASSATSCFIVNRYARVFVSICCRRWIAFSFSGLEWRRHDFLDCITLIALHIGRRLHTDLSSKGGV